MFTLSKTNKNDNTIEYLYDANGTKLKKIVTDNTTNPIAVTTIHYIDGFQYNGNTMDFFPTAEGYVKATHTSGGGIGGGGISFNYVYNYTDHLGNIRLRYAINPVNQWLVILEEDHYYPFGLKHQGYNGEHEIFEFDENISTVVLNPVNPLTGDKYKYKFNGMEYQPELGLEFYDFGMRNYDPAIGRWMNIDPLAEVSRRWSPYTYAYNNPIYFIDPDGMMAVSGSNLIKPNMLETASYERYVFWDGGGNSGGNDSGNNSTMEDYVDVDKTDAAPDVPESNLAAAGMTPGGGCGCPPDCDIPNIDDLDIEVGTIINTSSFKINVPHMNFWTGEYDSVSIDTDGDGLADSLLFPNSDSTNTNGSSDLKKESFIVQQILRLAFGSTVGQLFSSQGLSNGGNNYNYMQNTILGLPSDATQQQKDSVNLVRLGENYHNSLRKD